MHFSIGNAIPGRLHGCNPIDNREGNGGDRFSHLVDAYAWNSHCRYLDGLGSSGFMEEDCPYASGGQKGSYYFEFSRPLRTMECIQQDVQFKMGESSKMSNPWHVSGCYSINCDWASLDIFLGSPMLNKSSTGSSGRTASVFALLLSAISLCVSVFVGYRVLKPKNDGFQHMVNL